jgi:hypothetical protein
MMRALLLAVLALPSLALAKKNDPRIAKTVEAFRGSWSYDFSIVIDPKNPVKLTMTQECVVTGGGNGVFCTMKGRLMSQEMEQASLVAWDHEEQKGKMLTVNKTQEVRVWPCDWKDDKTFACGPVDVVFEGKRSQEKVEFVFTGKNEMKVVAEGQVQGVTIRTEGLGKRK